MIKILFVCHGNICRSPMAEFIMKKLVANAGLAQDFYIESAATSSEELGNPVYPPAAAKLAQHGISSRDKRARRIKPEDYRCFDLLIAMDRANIRNMQRLFGEDTAHKLHLLLEYAPAYARGREEVADPWYTGDFEAAWQDILAGCGGLLRRLAPAEIAENSLDI